MHPWIRRGAREVVKAAIVLMVAYATDHLADHFTVERIVDVREFNARLKDAIATFSPRSIVENFSSRLRQTSITSRRIF